MLILRLACLSGVGHRLKAMMATEYSTSLFAIEASRTLPNRLHVWSVREIDVGRDDCPVMCCSGGVRDLGWVWALGGMWAQRAGSDGCPGCPGRCGGWRCGGRSIVATSPAPRSWEGRPSATPSGAARGV